MRYAKNMDCFVRTGVTGIGLGRAPRYFQRRVGCMAGVVVRRWQSSSAAGLGRAKEASSLRLKSAHHFDTRSGENILEVGGIGQLGGEILAREM